MLQALPRNCFQTCTVHVGNDKGLKRVVFQHCSEVCNWVSFVG